MSELRLIVGIGNPGQDYVYTRHNLGFLVMQHLAQQHNLRWIENPSAKAMSAKGELNGREVLLLLPLTYVNQSGVAVANVVSKRKINLENILIVCDDLNIDFGQIRLRPSGSAGGHNGLINIFEHLKSKNIPRLRLGIGQPKKKEEAVHFVLGEFNPTEKRELPGFIQEAADCCVAWLSEGINKAMSQFNKRKEDE